MKRKLITMAALAATLVTTMIPASAMADDYHRGRDGGYIQYDRHGDRSRQDRHDWRNARRDERDGRSIDRGNGWNGSSRTDDNGGRRGNR